MNTNQPGSAPVLPNQSIQRPRYAPRQTMGSAWQLGAGPRMATPAADRNQRAVHNRGLGAWLRDFWGIES
jgi:hypothetical protein